MLVSRPVDVDEFIARSGNFLEQREAEHNLLLGICGRLRDDPRPYGQDPYFAIAEEGGRIVAIALRTPPHNLVLSEVDDERACDALAADIHEAFDALPGVLGPIGPVETFVHAWERLTGADSRLAIAERIYQAETVTPPVGIHGRMRPYANRDRELVIGWLEAFAAEAMPVAPPEETSSFLERRLAEADGGIVIWEDEGEPVSLAGFGGVTPNGIRVGPVYTPREQRGNGYATAIVAELTQTLLEGERRFCFLFTDLSNPVSNSIYQRVGYRPVSDVNEWAFD